MYDKSLMLTAVFMTFFFFISDEMIILGPKAYAGYFNLGSKQLFPQ